MLYIALSHLIRIGTQLAQSCTEHAARIDSAPRPVKSNGPRQQAVHDEDSMAEAWIKQRRRLKEAIERAQRENPPPEQPVSLDDEWVTPHLVEQRRIKEALAQAKRDQVPMDDADVDDEWANPWIEQQRRLKEALAQAKRDFADQKRKH